jgi:hypothetical protein
MRAIVLALALAAHPLHSTHTELREEPGGRLTVTVRAFTEDLQAAARRAQGAADDSSLARYVRGRLGLRDAGGREIPLAWAGARVDGGMTFLTLTAVSRQGMAGATLRQEMLTELFDDQVNVVQVRRPAGDASLLFLPGDRPKTLP